MLGSDNFNKSAILKEKDFDIAKKTFAHIKRRSWKSAFQESNKSSNKILTKIVRWIYLKDSNNQASFYDYLQFINENPDWPRIQRLKYLAEQKNRQRNSECRWSRESPLEILEAHLIWDPTK